jgi:hypothetical protein
MLRNGMVTAAALALLVGCGGTPPPQIVEAEGVIRLEGKPLKNVAVRFVPLDDGASQYMATGVTDKEGRFKLTCNGQPGACVGQNRVLVTEGDIPPRLQVEEAQLALARYFKELGGRPIPPRYGDLVNSPLIADVKAGQREYTFDLKRGK